MIARIATLLAVSSALFGLACGDQPRPKVEPTPEPAAEPSATRPEQPAAAKPSDVPDPSAEELPLPQDFEAEVAAQITAANFRQQMERLERELADQRQK